MKPIACSIVAEFAATGSESTALVPDVRRREDRAVGRARKRRAGRCAPCRRRARRRRRAWPQARPGRAGDPSWAHDRESRRRGATRRRVSLRNAYAPGPSYPYERWRSALAVEVEGLEKRYPKAPANAVDGVSFTVAAGRGVRPARAQRRGQDDHDRRAHDARAADARASPAWSASTSRTDAVRARSMLAVVPQRNNLDRSLSIRQNLIFHAAYHRVPGGRAQPPRRRAARAVRPHRPGGRQGRLRLRRPGPADHDRPGDDAHAAGALPRRAEHRPRPGGAPVRVGSHPRPARPGRDDRDHDPRHGRGRHPGRAGRASWITAACSRSTGRTRSHAACPARRRSRSRWPGRDGELEPALEALGRLDGVERLERLEPSDGHVRLYVTGEAPLMVAPGRDGPRGLRHHALRREDRRAEPRGRLHRPHRTGAAMSAPAATRRDARPRRRCSWRCSGATSS